MKTRYNQRSNQSSSGTRFRVASNGTAIEHIIKTVRNDLRNQHAKAFSHQGHLLTLALNEAEALAFQTDFPHLFFAELASEKISSALLWKRRQRILQRNGEASFAA